MDETPPFALNIHWRAAADEAQYLHSIPLFQTSVIEVLAIHDFQIQLNRHAFGLDGEFTQQIPNGGISPTASLFAVHLNLNRLRHRLSS
jgi:hypothetical protein